MSLLLLLRRKGNVRVCVDHRVERVDHVDPEINKLLDFQLSFIRPCFNPRMKAQKANSLIFQIFLWKS